MFGFGLGLELRGLRDMVRVKGLRLGFRVRFYGLGLFPRAWG